MTQTETVAYYDFDEDAAGLGAFITSTMENIPDDECVVYVRDGEGRDAMSARFVRQVLTDGSTVVNLIIEF